MELRFCEELAEYVPLKKTKLKLKRTLFLELWSTNNIRNARRAGVQAYCNLCNVANQDFAASWGFAVVVETNRELLIFDTGWDGTLLLNI